jgi:putative addiction module component (TIGR02574 family)
MGRALRRLEVLAETSYGFDMPLTLEQLAMEAMQLPVASRAQLADKLVESLDLAQPDEVQRLWAAEAVRRRDEIRSDQVKPVPGEQVLAEVRRLVGR